MWARNGLEARRPWIDWIGGLESGTGGFVQFSSRSVILIDISFPLQPLRSSSNSGVLTSSERGSVWPNLRGPCVSRKPSSQLCFIRRAEVGFVFLGDLLCLTGSSWILPEDGQDILCQGRCPCILLFKKSPGIRS